MARYSASHISGNITEADYGFMAAAIAMGYRNLGLARPNPSVGAVIVTQTAEGPVIVSQGVTAAGGRPHAERQALDIAGERARGATLYVTLEPCSHIGRDTPCADAIVASGIKRVVAGILDPDTRVAGHGFERLRQAGIEVVTGVLADEAAKLHRGHLTRVLKHRPAITLKLARTQDGFAGSGTAERLMITGELANSYTHMMRAHSDGILVGVNTVNADDPRLDVRLNGMANRSPIRVVLDGQLRINPDSYLVKTASHLPTWIVSAEGPGTSKHDVLCRCGCEVITVGTGQDGHLDLNEAMSHLADYGLSTILCEGGPTIASALAENDLLDEIVLVTGSTVFGHEGLLAFQPSLDAALASNFNLKNTIPAGLDVFAFYEKAY
ncbi:bifunctional diaminohydroxyphosphoribosylaminopyrimidine deaminase/5-amino-6-(5-phosphoribosylamino)uracil reductase RibD [Microvirga sp. W0021]|uniref:Riboflavin biosynthesis protein RibD n=1 Tax=Hohaiivirga grylli TaxID=3133970 RepID=A0ABV0BIV9_9HYPH